MENEIFEGKIVEVMNTIDTMYLLNNNDLFYDIGFKVMQNQENNYLLRCYRLKYNGKIKLTYFTSEYVPLSKMLMEADVGDLGNVLMKLFEVFTQVESLGFLNLACIDNRLDKIFVDRTTGGIKIIYLPVNIVGLQKNRSTFEGEIRSRLVGLMKRIQLSDNPKIRTIIEELSDGTLRLQDVGKKLQFSKAEVQQKTSNGNSKENSLRQEKGIQLQSLTTPLSFTITQSEFVLGKSKERVNGEIPGNPAISRVHCKISLKEGTYYIQDMGSANGTFVNGNRVSGTTPVLIEDGSHIKLANMEFIVRG